MEMSKQYFCESVKHLTKNGFVASEESVAYGENTSTGVSAVRVVLVRGAQERLVFECVEKTGRESLFFLEVVQFHGMRVPSFEIDSWKYWPNRIEFKYRSDPATAEGLAWSLYFESVEKET